MHTHHSAEAACESGLSMLTTIYVQATWFMIKGVWYGTKAFRSHLQKANIALPSTEYSSSLLREGQAVHSLFTEPGLISKFLNRVSQSWRASSLGGGICHVTHHLGMPMLSLHCPCLKVRTHLTTQHENISKPEHPEMQVSLVVLKTTF